MQGYCENKVKQCGEKTNSALDSMSHRFSDDVITCSFGVGCRSCTSPGAILVHKKFFAIYLVGTEFLFTKVHPCSLRIRDQSKLYI